MQSLPSPMISWACPRLLKSFKRLVSLSEGKVRLRTDLASKNNSLSVSMLLILTVHLAFVSSNSHTAPSIPSLRTIWISLNTSSGTPQLKLIVHGSLIFAVGFILFSISFLRFHNCLSTMGQICTSSYWYFRVPTSRFRLRQAFARPWNCVEIFSAAEFPGYSFLTSSAAERTASSNTFLMAAILYTTVCFK